MIRHITFFLICTFLHFKKKINIFLNTIKYYFKELYFLNLINNYFFISKKNIFKSKELNIFLCENTKFWKDKKYKNIKKNNSILVENFVNQPAYTMSNAIISQYLKKFIITTLLDCYVMEII